MRLRIAVLPGDGVGPEVTAEAMRVLEAVAGKFGHDLEANYHEIGGVAIKRFGSPLPGQTIEACFGADAVLLGSVGDSSFDHLRLALRPEAGLLALRREVDAFANLRPAIAFPSLLDSSPLKADVIAGTDILIVRELLGGLYFGEPRGSAVGEKGECAVDTMRYSEFEIERIARLAFDLARTRRSKLTSVDKANVLECSRLWRKTVQRMAERYPDVAVEYQYVDSCAMALVSRPSSFDVILTENMFGDILSDEAGAMTGSLGLLPSASIGGPVSIYEPVHGSAPDIAGRQIANPLGSILSAAMMLRHSFKLEREARGIEDAVTGSLTAGVRTADIAKESETAVTTAEMGKVVADRISSG